jgi:hypothetical protein
VSYVAKVRGKPVSGRVWKKVNQPYVRMLPFALTPECRARSIVKDIGLKSTWEKKMERKSIDSSATQRIQELKKEKEAEQLVTAEPCAR